MPRGLSKRSWDDSDESHNFLLNAKMVITQLKLSVTEIETRTTHPGYISMMVEKHGSVGLVIASRIAQQIGFSLDDLIKPPTEFQEIFRKDIGGDNDGAQ